MRRRPAGGLLALVLVLATAGPGCRSEPQPEAAPSGLPTSEFRGVELVHQEAGGDWWRLTAAEGVGWEGEGTGELREVHGEIRRAGHALSLDAGRAEVDEADEIRLSGGVEVRWDGYRARMERAAYGRGRGRVTSDAPVLLEGPGLEVRGRGMEVDVEKRTARVHQEVRARVGGGMP